MFRRKHYSTKDKPSSIIFDQDLRGFLSVFHFFPQACAFSRFAANLGGLLGALHHAEELLERPGPDAGDGLGQRVGGGRHSVIVQLHYYDAGGWGIEWLPDVTLSYRSNPVGDEWVVELEQFTPPMWLRPHFPTGGAVACSGDSPRPPFSHLKFSDALSIGHTIKPLVAARRFRLRRYWS